MIVLSANNLTKAYGTDLILQGISFHVNEGDRVGIIGVNGAGKTTSIKMLLGLVALISVNDVGRIWSGTQLVK